MSELNRYGVNKYEANAAFGRFVRSNAAPLDYFEYQHRATMLFRARRMFVSQLMSIGFSERQAWRHARSLFTLWHTLAEWAVDRDGILIVSRKLYRFEDDRRS